MGLLSAQARIGTDQFIYFVSDAPFSPMCSVFVPHWSNDPTRGNFLLSGSVLGAVSGLGSQSVLGRGVPEMILCMCSEFSVLAVRYS